MTVSKELIRDLNIISMAVASENSGEIPCVITKYENERLLFTLLQQEKNEFKKDRQLTLRTNLHENEADFTTEESTLEVIECGIDYVVAKVIRPSKTLALLLERLSFLDFHDKTYGRRKEPRIKIGKERFAEFGLSSPEQKIFSKTAKIIQPCAILDASVHGICIITPFENPAFKNIENFSIHLSFVNPEQTVLLQAHKVHAKLNAIDGKTFATISCQLLEPIHYVWKERVINLLEKQL